MGQTFLTIIDQHGKNRRNRKEKTKMYFMALGSLFIQYTVLFLSAFFLFYGRLKQNLETYRSVLYLQRVGMEGDRSDDGHAGVSHTTPGGGRSKLGPEPGGYATESETSSTALAKSPGASRRVVKIWHPESWVPTQKPRSPGRSE